MDVRTLTMCLADRSDRLDPRWFDEHGSEMTLEDAGLRLGATFSDVTYDSRACGDGALYVCKGAAFNEGYLDDARRRGAVAYLAQRAYPGHGLVGVVVRDVRRAMGRAADEFFGHPSASLDLVGITGTKGKTTVSFYLDAMLRARKKGKSGLIGGVYCDVGEGRVESHNTTPESVELQRMIARARDNDCDTVVMEVSSQALKYDRTLGCDFAAGLFTNIGEDHISPIEHPTFEDYFASKLRLFDQCATAVVNVDADEDGRIRSAASRCDRTVSYSCARKDADVHLESCKHTEGGWMLEVAGCDGSKTEVAFGGFGRVNVSNALAAIAAAEALGVRWQDLVGALADVRVPGRMERYVSRDGSIVGVVDYAHNELSLTALLECVREEYPGREITVVFGSTGMKAQHRRPGLGRAAAGRADRIILTEDEPGNVPVADICAEIGAEIAARGFEYEVVEDREQAIERAVRGASRPAVVVLAGKGIENTMLRADGPQPYPTDAVVLRSLIGLN